MTEVWDKSGLFWTDAERSAQRYKTGLDNLTATMLDNAKRVTKEVNSAIDTIRGIEQTQDRVTGDLAKALNSQTVLISKLQASIDSLNGTLNAALGQSLDAMNAANTTATKTAETMEKSTARMDGFAQQFKQGMDTLSGVTQKRRRLRRDKDNSWIVESD